VTGQFHALAALSHRESTPSTHLIGDLVGSTASFTVVVKRKIPPPVGTQTLVVHPVAS